MMQAAQLLTPLPPVDRLNEVEQFVSRNLCGDWVLRVEHTATIAPRQAHWQQWGEAMYAIEDTAPLLDTIAECRYAHPTHNLRLCAERFQPEVRLVYWI